MGYRIQYGSSGAKESLGIQSLLPILLLCICCAIIFAAVNYREAIWNWILPGDAEITEKALLTFFKDVRSGISMKEAAETFCKEIIYSAIY